MNSAVLILLGVAVGVVAVGLVVGYFLLTHPLIK